MHCIAILKTMEQDPRHGEAAKAALAEQAELWARFSLQRHDLFVSHDVSARRDLFLTQGEAAEARAKQAQEGGLLLNDAAATSGGT